MKIRILDLVLLLFIVGGGFVSWRSGRQRSLLSAEYQRLVGKTGELTVVDPTRVQVRAIPTGDPKSFAWRVYLPPNYTQILRQSGGASSSSTTSDAREFIARVRFGEDAQGRTRVFTRFVGGSSDSGLAPKPLADLLRGRWDQLQVEQIGSARPVTLEPGKSVVILELRIPAGIRADAQKVLTADEITQFAPALFRLELGPADDKP